MPTITLPETPGPRSATPRFIDWGTDQRPPLGGATTRLVRLGSRFAIDVQMPPMPTEPTGRIWVSKLLQGKVAGRVRMEWPQLSLPAFAGLTVVQRNLFGNPASLTTSLTVLAAGTPAAVVQDGRFITIYKAATQRRYLHMIAGDAEINGDGNVVLTLANPLRVSLVGGTDKVEFGANIEGFLIGDEREWNLDSAHHAGLAFSIEEIE